MATLEGQLASCGTRVTEQGTATSESEQRVSRQLEEAQTALGKRMGEVERQLTGVGRSLAENDVVGRVGALEKSLSETHALKVALERLVRERVEVLERSISEGDRGL
eukprot:152047_1